MNVLGWLGGAYTGLCLGTYYIFPMISLALVRSYRGRKDTMEDLLAKSEKAFSLGGITVLDLLDTRKTYRDFMTRFHQALIQALLNEDLLKVYTGELQ